MMTQLRYSRYTSDDHRLLNPSMVREMSGSKVEAVIWDMDGVIADTAPYHLNAWQEVFQKRGVKFTEEDFKHSFGLRNDTIIRNILGEEISQDEIGIIAAEKEAIFRSCAYRISHTEHRGPKEGCGTISINGSF